MNGAVANDDRALRELPEGMLEYELRCAIRNVRLVFGFEAMRETAARMINDEADRSARK